MPILVRHDNYGMMGTLAAGAGQERLRQILEQEKARRDQLAMQQLQNDRQYGLQRQSLADQRKRDQRNAGLQQDQMDLQWFNAEQMGDYRNNSLEAREADRLDRKEHQERQRELARNLSDDRIIAAARNLQTKINAGTATREDEQNHGIAMEEMRSRNLMDRLNVQQEGRREIVDVQQQGMDNRLNVQQQGMDQRLDKNLAVRQQLGQAGMERANQDAAFRNERDQYGAQDRALETAVTVAKTKIDRLNKVYDGMDYTTRQDMSSQFKSELEQANQALDVALEQLYQFRSQQPPQRPLRQAPATQPAMPSANPQPIAPAMPPAAPATQPTIGQGISPQIQQWAAASAGPANMPAPSQGMGQPQTAAIVQTLDSLGLDWRNPNGFMYQGRRLVLVGEQNGVPMFQVVG